MNQRAKESVLIHSSSECGGRLDAVGAEVNFGHVAPALRGLTFYRERQQTNRSTNT
jgi:hypothetical protein